MTREDDCPFCAIVAGELEASRVHEDERTVAFLDVRPVNDGHTLVVPRTHAPGLDDLDAEDAAQLMRVAQRAAAAIRRSGLRAEGVNLWLADGAVAGQEVFHVHLHVVPRFRGDGFGLRFGPDYRARRRTELDATAAKLRAGWR